MKKDALDKIQEDMDKAFYVDVLRLEQENAELKEEIKRLNSQIRKERHERH